MPEIYSSFRNKMRSLFTEVNFFRFLAICFAVLTLKKTIHELSDGPSEWIFLSNGSIVSPDWQISLWERFIGPHSVRKLEEDVCALYAALKIVTGFMMLYGIFTDKAQWVRPGLWVSSIILLLDLYTYIWCIYYITSHISIEASLNYITITDHLILLEVFLRQVTRRFVNLLEERAENRNRLNFFKYVARCFAVLALGKTIHELSAGHRELIFLSDGSIVSPDRQISLWEEYFGPQPVFQLEQDVSLLCAALGILTGSIMLYGIYMGQARWVRRGLWVSWIILLIDLYSYVSGMYFVASHVSLWTAFNFYKDSILLMLLELVLGEAIRRFVNLLERKPEKTDSNLNEVTFYRLLAICFAVLALGKHIYELSAGHREWIFLSDGSIVSPDCQISLWERFIGPHPVLEFDFGQAISRFVEPL